MANKPRAEMDRSMRSLMDELITTQQAAKMLGVLPHQVWNLLKAGKIIGKKFGHDWIVYAPSLKIYRAAKSAKGRPPSGSKQ